MNCLRFSLLPGLSGPPPPLAFTLTVHDWSKPSGELAGTFFVRVLGLGGVPGTENLAQPVWCEAKFDGSLAP